MKLFTIFGDPVSHSISPLLHNRAIRELNLDACYTRTHLKDGSNLRKIFEDLGLDGANVTVPHKENAYRQCDEIRGVAKKIKAINTIIKEKDKLIGYNTDAPGFYESTREFKNVKNALILGAGGTAKAIATILKEKNIKTTILNRSKNRLAFFEKEGFSCFDWSNFEKDNNIYDIVINTTSAGLKDNALPVPKDLLNTILKDAKYATDVIYNKKTLFLKAAQNADIQTKDGSDMLLYQGVIAFNLFFDNKLSLYDISKAMRPAFEL